MAAVPNRGHYNYSSMSFRKLRVEASTGSLVPTVQCYHFHILYRKLHMSPHRPFQIKCESKESGVEVLGAFSEVLRRKYALPIPPNGWNCTLLTFTAESNASSYKFIFEGTYA